MQPSPPNPDHEPSGVQQEISDGSSNHGLMQGADVGGDSNQISGDGNRISQSQNTQNFFILPNPEPSKLVSKSRKTFRFLRERPQVLISLALIPILGITAISIPQIRDELLHGELCCFREAQKEGIKAIAVINFDNSLGNQNVLPFLETQIKDNPGGLQTLPNVKVCRNTQERVSDSEQAKKLGNKLGAAVVIWGRRDTSKLQVRITKVVKPDLSNLTTLSIYNNNPLDEEILPLVTVMTASALSRVYHSENLLPDAQAILEQALNRAELSLFNLDNKKTVQVLSDAYFNLGNLYNPTKDRNCSEATEFCHKALKNYQKASKIDKKFYEPIVSQGRIYERLRKPLEAIKVWSQIIKSDPESNTALEVRTYRADIYFKQSRFMEAAEDLAFICQRQSCKPDILHTLGLAQLQAKQIEFAKKTYQDVKLYLKKDKKLRAEVVQDLLSLKNKNSDLIPTLETIIAALN